MDEVDRLHQAYEKTDDVAEVRNAQASAMAQLQADREKAILEGGPTPEEMEAERQRKGRLIQKGLAAGIPGEEIEAWLEEQEGKVAGRDKRASSKMGSPAQVPDLSPAAYAQAGQAEQGTRIQTGGSFQDALAGAVEQALADETGEEAWYRGGNIHITWGISKAEDGDGAEIGFQIQLPGEEEPGVLVVDLDEKRLDTWSRGLQNADGPRRFAYGLVSKIFEVASQNVSAALLGAITEVQEGLHLPWVAEPAEEPWSVADHIALPDMDEDEAPPMSEEARAFLLRNAEQGEPEVVSYGVTPEEAAEVAERAQAAIEEAMKDAE
jgi:hypothetical protein